MSQVEASWTHWMTSMTNSVIWGVDYGYLPPQSGLPDGAVTFKLHEYDQIVPHM